ncbi:MAG TPA: MFS transporter [Candidatus Methylomirabilis sp.]|nr:MFS transporter [Candidatus Methylomirabilis sp.]
MRATFADERAKNRDILVLTTAQFFLAFSLNFMFVFLPFYILEISTLDEAATLRWTGLIVGGASAMSTFASTFWAKLTERFSPKAIFERGVLSHAILVALMGFVTDLRLLLVLRLLQGFFGGISTIGLIIISAISDSEQLPRRMGTYQSALTLGQIFSPPMGAMAAAAFGFRGAFLASSTMLFAIFTFCLFGLSPMRPRPRRAVEPIPRRQLWLAWAIAFAGTVQIVFLPSVLPVILQSFKLPEARQLVVAGTIVFAYGASAAAGSYLFSRLTHRYPPNRLILLAAVGSSCLQVLLILGVEPMSFTLIRMAQTFLAAGVFPLILTGVAARSHAGTIGFINTSRFAGNAAGPIIATFILANSNLLSLYLVLAVGLAVVAAGHYIGEKAQSGIR